MRRRSRAGGRSSKRATLLRRRTAPKSARRGSSAVTNLNEKIALVTRERDEALEYQEATSDVLRAISNSATDPASTLGAIAESVTRLIDVSDAEILRREGSTLRSVAKRGSSTQWPLGTTRPLNRDWVTGRAVIDQAVVHVTSPRGRISGRSGLCAPVWAQNHASRSFVARR